MRHQDETLTDAKAVMDEHQLIEELAEDDFNASQGQ